MRGRASALHLKLHVKLQIYRLTFEGKPCLCHCLQLKVDKLPKKNVMLTSHCLFYLPASSINFSFPSFCVHFHFYVTLNQRVGPSPCLHFLHAGGLNLWLILSNPLVNINLQQTLEKKGVIKSHLKIEIMSVWAILLSNDSEKSELWGNFPSEDRMMNPIKGWPHSALAISLAKSLQAGVSG